MARDHKAVNDQALALLDKLGVTPEDNPTSQKLSADAAAKLQELGALDGAAFDAAYVANEVSFHQAVNAALADVLIPAAQNEELEALLQTGLTLFSEHQVHAEHLAMEVK
jgi:putative membrane protein